MVLRAKGVCEDGRPRRVKIQRPAEPIHPLFVGRGFGKVQKILLPGDTRGRPP